MRLKKVTLNNFRCFRHLEVDLHPRLTVVVGENGAGKTALLDGIATGLSPVLRYLSSAQARLEGRGIKDADFQVQQKTGRGGVSRWVPADFAQAVLETTDGLVWDNWRPAVIGAEPEKKVGQSALKARLEVVSQSYQSQQPRLTPVVAYYGARRGYLEVPERLRGTREIYEHPASALIGALDSLSDFRELLAWFDQEEAAEYRFKNEPPHVAEEFAGAPALDAVRRAVIEILGGQYVQPRFNSDHKFVLTRAADGAQLQVAQLSQGYQSMLAMAMDFARRLAIANRHLAQRYAADTWQIKEVFDALVAADPAAAESEAHVFERIRPLVSPAIMLVDEIDLHLHPAWQQRVLADLMRTFPLTQFIVTTHSPQVLSTVSRENIRVLTNHDGVYAARTPDFSPLAHEAGDALTRIMQVHQEPELAIQEQIRRYEQLVRAGQESSDEAQTLKVSVEKDGYQFHDSDLAIWRFLAQHKPEGPDGVQHG
jgi:predicted ATP-binding protein involved in virulence